MTDAAAQSGRHTLGASLRGGESCTRTTSIQEPAVSWRPWSSPAEMAISVSPAPLVAEPLASSAVAESSGFPRLDEAAAAAVRRWVFSPAVQDAVAVPTWTQVSVVFQLTAEGSSAQLAVQRWIREFKHDRQSCTRPLEHRWEQSDEQSRAVLRSSALGTDTSPVSRRWLRPRRRHGWSPACAPDRCGRCPRAPSSRSVTPARFSYPASFRGRAATPRFRRRHW